MLIIFGFIFGFSGDIEENLGPKPSSNQNFSICHWNLSSISAYNYIKVSLLRAYTCTHKFDVICISETYLDSDKSDDDNNLKIAGYNLTRADYPSNTKCMWKNDNNFRLIQAFY